MQVTGTAEVVDYFSEEYIAAAVYKKIPIEALRKLPEPMNLIKVAPSKIEFLNSEFKKYGCEMCIRDSPDTIVPMHPAVLL